MALNDLINEIKLDSNNFCGDEGVENKVLYQVLALVEDKISEVKNQAVKCLGQLIKILRQTQMETVVDKLIDFAGGLDDELRDISSLALKTITAELPVDSKIAVSACARLTPKLLEQLSKPDVPPETLIEALSILSILVSRFPGHLAAHAKNLNVLNLLAPSLHHSRAVVRKRCIVAISQFVTISEATQFSSLFQKDIAPYLESSASVDRKRTTVQLAAAIVRQSPFLVAPLLDRIVPGVLSAVQVDDDELRESCLQALETFLLRCPVEITKFLSSIVKVGTQFIKFDPNYAADEDADEDMDSADDDDDDDDLEGDEFSDDEDTSYKTRRAATKLLAAFIETRPELLVSIYKEVSPVLISRFGDREETVRLEVWATYGILFRQTSTYGGALDTVARGKRKRDADVLDAEGGPCSLLKAQSSGITKSLLGQLKASKQSSATLQAGFQLLHSALTVLPGCLAHQVSALLTICKNVLSQPNTTSNSSLHLTVLTFLSLFFSSHPPASFQSSLSDVFPVLLKSLKERHPRISSEAFRVFFALLNAMKPVKNGEWVDALYAESVTKLQSNDLDSEVAACAQECIGELWICATDVMAQKNRSEWTLVCKTNGRTDTSVLVVTKVAQSIVIDDNWVNGCLEWLMNLVKRSGKTGKSDIFVAIEVLLGRYTTVPVDLAPALVPLVKTYLNTSDISLLALALSVLSQLLLLSPSSSFLEIERDVLSDIYVIAHSPLVSGVALDSLLDFFSALVQADNQIASHVVPNLVIAIDQKPPKDTAPSNVAQSISRIAQAQQGIAAGTIAEYAKNIRKESKAKSSRVVLSLLILGEIGSFFDMSPQPEVFNNAIGFFTAEEEEVRTAAAFCAGNIAIGNLQQFLPTLVNMVQNDSKKRLPSLHALKETVTHCSHAKLENVADMLWGPLFENSETTEESTRNVAAACLGKLAVIRPARYLPQLHSRITENDAGTRAIVVSAIRYTFGDTDQSYDDQLAPVLVDFLALMSDEDLTVRRLALSTLNSAAKVKPQLIQDHLHIILPNLYKETEINPALIRVVQMGPWQHKVDDGLEARKTAYETMYTLLDTSLAKLDLNHFLARVIVGLGDDSDEIKVISHMVLFRLSQVAPAAVSQRLDEMVPVLDKTMKGAIMTKDTVKQDLERAAELQKSALRAIVALNKIGAGVSPKFDVFVDGLKKHATLGNDFKELSSK
jgi:cullin-associated NEDD8-dissociated protein 1